MGLKSIVALLGTMLAVPLFAATLAPGMSRAQVEDTVAALGPGGATRLMRSAEAYPLWPGIKLGLETVLFPSNGVGTFGNGTGSVPSTVLIPRLYLAKGLIANIDVVMSLLPGGVINTLETYGVALKWTFLSERENIPGSVALYGAYTKIRGFDRYSGHDWEIGILASRDLVRIRPYAGLGLLFARGTVAQAATLESTADVTRLHAFAGFEWELPATITFQLEVMNLELMGTLMIGKRFF